MKVNLAYGKTGLSVELPADRTTVIEPVYIPGLPHEEDALRRALPELINRLPLRELVRTNQTVAIAVCDITRPIRMKKRKSLLMGAANEP